MEEIIDDIDPASEKDASRTLKTRFRNAGIWMVVSGLGGFGITFLLFYYMKNYYSVWTINEKIILLFGVYLFIRSALVVMSGIRKIEAYSNENASALNDAFKSYNRIWQVSFIFCAALAMFWLVYISAYRQTYELSLLNTLFGVE